MSFVRWSADSDLYVFTYGRGEDGVVCFACPFSGDPEDNPLEYMFQELEDMLEHIRDHRAVKHVVPYGLEDKLKQRWPF